MEFVRKLVIFMDWQGRLAVPKRHKGPKPRNYTTHFGILRGSMIATPRKVLSELALSEGPGPRRPTNFGLYVVCHAHVSSVYQNACLCIERMGMTRTLTRKG